MLAHPQKKGDKGFNDRVVHVGLALLLAVLVLLGRLWQLQGIRGYHYRKTAEEQRLHPQRLKARRGMILGRDNVVLADNRPACDIVFVPAECDDLSGRPRTDALAAVCWRLADLIGIDAAHLAAEIDRRRGQPFEQIAVKRDVSKGDLIRVEEHSYALPGVFTVVSPQRRYLHGAVAGQLLGYLGEIVPDELARHEGHYRMGDRVGRAGIELMYEDALHGIDGHTLVTRYRYGSPQLRTDLRGKPYIAQRDSYGHRLKEHQRLEPQVGGKVHLTLDIGLQACAEALLGETVGAIVVLDADTGEVLALASTPTYDPSVFVERGRDREREDLLLAGHPKPMLNRAFRETYPPGSVFKVLLACAALEEGLINETNTFFCPGYYQIGGQGRKWRCWKRHGHGTVNVVDALAFSCDVFFYNVGSKLGIDTIGRYAHDLGLGRETGLDLPFEAAGLIPSRAWLKQRRTAKYPDEPWEWEWRAGDTLNTSIGQGFVATTPLQVAVLMAAVVNDGFCVRPYLNEALGREVRGPFLSEATLAVVRKGLRKCVEKDDVAPTGTDKAAKIPGWTVLGKTGSAQVVSLARYEDFVSEDDIPYDIRDHAWFVAGVLDRTPRIAVCVLVEHGHHGSSVAAPLAKEVIQYFYRNEREAPVTVAKRGDAS